MVTAVFAISLSRTSQELHVTCQRNKDIPWLIAMKETFNFSLNNPWDVSIVCNKLFIVHEKTSDIASADSMEAWTITSTIMSDTAWTHLPKVILLTSVKIFSTFHQCEISIWQVLLTKYTVSLFIHFQTVQYCFQHTHFQIYENKFKQPNNLILGQCCGEVDSSHS